MTTELRERPAIQGVLASITVVVLATLTGTTLAQDVNLSSGLETRREGDGPAHRVTWIEWDSPFRGSGLLVGDVLVGMNGAPFDQAMTQTWYVGQSSESRGFAELGLTSPGATLTLLVDRDGTTVEISAPLAQEVYRNYESADGERLLSPDGPPWGGRDGFDTPWVAWHRNLKESLSQYLSYGMDVLAPSRTVFEDNEQHRERLAYLIQNYEGPFAQAVLEDWRRLRGIFAGEVRELSDADLVYRQFGGEIVQQVAAAGREAAAAVESRYSADFVEAFPALDPTRDDLSTVAGKVVRVDDLTGRNYRGDSGSLVLVIGDRGRGVYFVRQEDGYALREAIDRYSRGISDQFRDSFTVYGRITGEPAASVLGDFQADGLELSLLGVAVGDPGFFVDFEQRSPDGLPVIVGAESIVIPEVPDLPDDASPAQVLETMVAYVKAGDSDGWLGLFADWQVRYDGSLETDYSRPRFDFEYAWGKSRESLFDDVYDVTVGKVSEPIVVVGQRADEGPSRADAILGLDDDEDELEDRAAMASESPLVEEVDAQLDFVGRFGNEYRTFTQRWHTRRWKLQRVNGGPWRIVEPETL